MWAEPVAAHLQLFDDVLATDATVNLKGVNKTLPSSSTARLMVGPSLNYWGDAPVDLRIWNAPNSARIVAVNPSRKTLAAIQATNKETQIFANRLSRGWAVLRAMRPQQWIKNLLLFIQSCYPIKPAIPYVFGTHAGLLSRFA